MSWNQEGRQDIMWLLRHLCIFLMTLSAYSFAHETSVPICAKILSYVESNLPHHGILKNRNGFVYVDLDDEYVHALSTFIEQEGFQEPPYFGNAELVGAHITVMYSEEVRKYGVKEIQECGSMIFFTPTQCQIVHPAKWEEIDEVYIIVVEAPQLDQIREKYGLPKKEYAFHITIGVKPKLAQSA